MANSKGQKSPTTREQAVVIAEQIVSWRDSYTDRIGPAEGRVTDRSVRHRIACLEATLAMLMHGAQTGLGICLMCGCTDAQPCIDAIGAPCSWADREAKLCSACDRRKTRPLSETETESAAKKRPALGQRRYNGGLRIARAGMSSRLVPCARCGGPIDREMGADLFVAEITQFRATEPMTAQYTGTREVAKATQVVCGICAAELGWHVPLPGSPTARELAVETWRESETLAGWIFPAKEATR